MRRLLALGSLAIVVALVVALAAGASDGDGGDYKVRAIFDNAFSLIEGEDVRVSGVKVGTVSDLEVTEDNRAAVVLDITREGFKDFRRDAACTIRPQSLIGERYVECRLTQPRSDGRPPPPELPVIPEGRPGAGQRLLPVEQTSKPVDLDLLNDIARLPEQQRIAIILNELGAGVAGRGDDLNETIRRANPALGATNRVLEILADQNRVLRRLAEDADRVLEPLARDRERVAGFIEQAERVARATAERRADLERTLERLPRFLAELRPTMERLRGFSEELEPVLADLRQAAPQLNTLVERLGPFSQAGIPAVEELGDAARVGRPALVASKPIVDDVRRLVTEARPLAADLAALTTSVRDTGGIERLMDLLFLQVAALNGYDALGHYLRAGLIVNTCSQYTATPQPGCSARLTQQDGDAGDEAGAARATTARAPRSGAGAARDAAGAGQGARRSGAAARRDRSGADRPLALPRAILPGGSGTGSGTGRASDGASGPGAARSGAGDPAREAMLDYLLGGGP
jgi:virulence factor Mce-like protein